MLQGIILSSTEGECDVNAQIQIGDIVRVRQTIVLVPLDKRTPSEIPGGIYGQVVDIAYGLVGEILCWVEFHEPYEYINMAGVSIDENHLELVFRIPEF